jgi:hypothetical protein
MTTPDNWSFTTSGAGACPCTIWESDAAPSNPAVNDSNSVELGVKFQSSVNGWVSGVRFYKGPGNTGTHTGSLWTDSGTLLARGTFTGETASGWQTLEFPTAVQIQAGQTYVASYYAPNGNYADTPGSFNGTSYSNPPLTALQDGAHGGNGLYAYGGDQFPNNSYGSANYWVDPIFWASQPPDFVAPSVSTTNPSSGQTNVPMGIAVSFTFNKQVQASSVQFTLTGPGGTSVPGTLSYDSSSETATFTPSSALSSTTSYTATVSAATDTAGKPMSGPYSWNFMTAAPPQCPCSIWPSSAQPAIANAGDYSSVNLGVKFTTDENGWITGIRFYKGSGNAGTHVGSLWDANGNLLGQVTFTGESASGWQQANFSAPIPVTAGTTYVASYFAPNGGYSVTSAAFASAGVNNSPLHVPASSAVSGGNGVFVYGGAPAFPTSSYNAGNYWVDVVFSTTGP